MVVSALSVFGLFSRYDPTSFVWSVSSGLPFLSSSPGSSGFSFKVSKPIFEVSVVSVIGFLSSSLGSPF